MASHGKYLLSCSGRDTKVNLWDTKGTHLASIVTGQIENRLARFSPDGRFVAVGTTSSELRIWEVIEDKNGLFKSFEKAISGQSKGLHKRAVTCLDFTKDSKQILTGSEDGTWKTWNIDVNFKRDEEARCLSTIVEPTNLPFLQLEVSPDTRKVATVSSDNTIRLWDFATGVQYDSIPRAHIGTITCICWSHNSKFIASSGTDARVHLWKAEKQ